MLGREPAGLTLLDGVGWQGRPVTGARSHELLALLAEAWPQPVSASALVSAIWGDEPTSPTKALQVLVSRTRTRTAPGVIEHSQRGYRLGVDPGQVDALRLTDLTRQAEAAVAGSAWTEVVTLAESALTESVAGTDSAPPGSEALARVRARARQDRERVTRLLGEGELARGEHRAALEHLLPALASHPDDERLLATTLRAEAVVHGVPAALRRYAEYHRRARDELGASPGPELQAVHAELLAREAPVRAGLKFDATPMVGRDEDVRHLRTLLSGSRVVSIVGPGGLGKTRLAHLVGREAVQPVVHFIELAGVRSGDAVLPEIAAALGVRDSLSGTRTLRYLSDLLGRTAQLLSGPPTLLIVDNCEQVVADVADVVARLVSLVPELRVLATSRAPLGLAGERVHLLPQLDGPAAAELFVERARAARPGVMLEDERVAELVDRLDGLPLAIELAAVKVRVMSVAEIVLRLDDRFAVLRGGDRSAPDRHQTLEAVIDWSWALLGESERRALRLLAVFPDGFSLDGAEAMLGHSALTSVSHLVDQSLLVVRESDGIRYRFLETVREYGLARLQESGESDAALRAVDDWAVATARLLRAGLDGRGQVPAVQTIRAESGNLAVAMRRSLTAGDLRTAVPLVDAMGNFWTIEGEYGQVFWVADAFLALLPAPGDDAARTTGLVEEPDALRSALATLVTGRAVMSGDIPAAAVQWLELLGPGPAGGVVHGSVRTLMAISRTVGPDGQVDADQLSEVLEVCAEETDPVLAGTALLWRSQLLENDGELRQALVTGRRALGKLALLDAGQGPWFSALLHAQVGAMALQLGEFDEAVRMAALALPALEELGALDDVIALRTVQALERLRGGDVRAAGAALQSLRVGADYQAGLGWLLLRSAQAEVTLAQGDIELGLAMYLESIDDGRQRAFPGFEVPAEVTPWVVYPEAACVLVHVVHGAGDRIGPLATELMAKLPRLLGDDVAGSMHTDLPVAGMALVAIGSWLVDQGSDLFEAQPIDLFEAQPIDLFEIGARMSALGERFGYNRAMPSCDWSHQVARVDARRPGVLATFCDEYAGSPSRALRQVARDLAAQAQTALR